MPGRKKINKKALLTLSAVGALAVVATPSPNPIERYKTHLPPPFSSSNSGLMNEQQPGQAPSEREKELNPLLSPQMQMQQENENRNRSVAKPNQGIAGWADTSKWSAPANSEPGSPSNAPGSSNTSPESRDRDFETFGRAIPFTGS
ncbi:MAG: hypothetical protein P4M08_02000 [Oligoflexia bacterium]|nr:hypothetical protein [Oligoflexia bacterium]